MAVKNPLKGKMKSLHEELQSLRKDGNDITLKEHLETSQKYGLNYVDDPTLAIDHLYHELGINPNTMSFGDALGVDDDTRWLVPEIIRDSIRKGLKKSPMYPTLRSQEISVAQPSVVMPTINASAAATKERAEAETIGTGTISYADKTIKLKQSAIGLQMTDEAVRFSRISLASIFFQDLGVQLGAKLDADMLAILVSGDQADSSEATAEIGIATANTLIYKDLLRAWIRASGRGKSFSNIIAGEDIAMDILDLDEFKLRRAGATDSKVNLKTAVPNSANLWVHESVAANKMILVDPSAALVQFTAIPLTLESERIVQRKMSGTYANIMTGFANLFRDGRIQIDTAATIGAKPFPSWFGPVSTNN